MKTIYCIALEGEGPTGVNWYHTEEARDAMCTKTGAQIEVQFDMPVPVNATHNEITERADRAAWDMTYFPKRFKAQSRKTE